MLDIQSEYLVIGISPKRGRGVFAKKKLYTGLVIGITPSWELSPDDISAMDRSTIEGFWFDHPSKIGWGLLPLGIAALLNHSSKPNSCLDWSITETGYIGKLTSIEKIDEGHEIFIDYKIFTPEDWV